MNPMQSSEQQGSSAPRSNPVANLIARMSLTQMTLTVLTLVFIWQWFDAHQQLGAMQQEVTRRLSEMAGNNQANQVLVAQQQEAVRDVSAKVALLEARFAETQDQRAALEALYSELSASRDENALADVEQLLLIAAQQLQLSANVKAALIAVQNADARLQRMGRSSFNGLRLIINQDMEKLRALPDLDVAGLNAQIGNLMLAVDSLPLGYQQRVTSPVAIPSKEETAWQKLVREIWQEAKQLVRIQDTGKAEIPLLPPNQEFFLRENLKLHLMAARLALLSHDEASFRQEFVSMQDWVQRYFDANSAEGAHMLGALQKFTKLGINVDLPDISASLQAVRNYRVTREKETHTGGR
jgi:uroporphyrin-3 C-methyltransferase